MFFRPFGLGVCLVVCVGCLFGNLSRRDAQTQERPPTAEVWVSPKTLVFSENDINRTRASSHDVTSESRPDVSSRRKPGSPDASETDFYQTILRKNLFAPLGTVLNPEPVPGTHLSLVGTFVSQDPSASSVLVKNATTGRHHLLSVGEGVGDFHVLAVEAKQVRFYHHGTEVSLHLPENVFLNPKRR